MGVTIPAELDTGRLRHLADLNGIATSFWDWHGQLHDVREESLIAVLDSLGVKLPDPLTGQSVEDAIRATEDRRWLEVVPACQVSRAGTAAEIPVHVPHGTNVSVSLFREDGEIVPLSQLDRWVPPHTTADDRTIGRAAFELPADTPLGYHRIEATLEDGTVHRAPLIVVPDYLNPSALAHNRRSWGIQAQLYSVCSKRSWGIGDAADLSDLLALGSQRGADFMLINPLHASFPRKPMENSPYLPVTRRWVNPIYVRPEHIVEYVRLSDGDRAHIQKLRERAAAPAPDGLIDRDRVWENKLEALEIIFSCTRATHREAEFRHYVEVQGEALQSFAEWCAIAEAVDVEDLPDDLSDPKGAGVAAFLAERGDRVEFWKWCQWVSRSQLAEAQQVAKTLGMGVGVMSDLAVGVHPHGSDTWANRDAFARGMSVGAPPDMYSQHGQNWSQPPWSPRGLAESGYEPLRAVVGAALATSGAVRIDHILGLFRLWWIPDGHEASDGTYVYYDHEAMVGVLMLEAARRDAVVIGEDLGTVEPWVREYLASRGILGTSVLWFEKEDSGWPIHADHYRRNVLATVNIHDLPPTAGYLEGVQTELRSELGLLIDDIEDVRARDREELREMMVRLHEYGLLAEDDTDEQHIVEALYRYICRTPSQLLGVSLVDAVGDRRPQNLPGTSKEYPNWCVPLSRPDGEPILLDDLEDDDRFNHLFAVVKRELGD